MSRATADRQCGDCGWHGHVVEDAPYICPNCDKSMIPQPIRVTWPPKEKVADLPPKGSGLVKLPVIRS